MTRSVFVLLAAASVGFAQRVPIEPQLTFTPYHPTGIYEVGETMGWAVTPGPTIASPRLAEIHCSSASTGWSTTKYLTAKDLVGRQRFPLERVDYGAVIQWKVLILAKAAKAFFRRASERDEFDRYCARNAHWLDAFATFMAGKQRDFGEDVHRYWQFEFDRQWSALREHCRHLGIRIIGDLPIYVTGDSSHVASHPDLFCTDVVAGDDFDLTTWSPIRPEVEGRGLIRFPPASSKVLGGMSLLLPAATKVSVDFNQARKFIQLGLSQAQFGAEGVGFIGQHLQVAGRPTPITDIRKPRRILCRHDQLLLMLAEFVTF